MMAINSILFDSTFIRTRAHLQRRGRSQGAIPGTSFLKSCLLFLLIGFLFTGCASVPKDYPRTPSTAYQDYLDTSVGQLFEEAAVQHPGESVGTVVRPLRPALR
jgi:hypothetical protein